MRSGSGAAGEADIEALFLLVPLSLLAVGLAVLVFFRMNAGGQFDDDEGPAWSVLMDDDRPPTADDRATSAPTPAPPTPTSAPPEPVAPDERPWNDTDARDGGT